MNNLNLSESDYKEIAMASGLSSATVRKWFNDTLSVKTETQIRILDGWLRVCKQRILSIDNEVSKNQSFINKLGSINSLYLETKADLSRQLDKISSFSDS